MNTPQLRGFARDIRYTPCLTPSLPIYTLPDFDINIAKPSGVIDLGGEDRLGYSKWKSPKRTRTYPFARIYNTYHLNTKRVTVIPVIKDEGAESSNNDRVNFITFSWMNLMNVYIILAWYESARPKPGSSGLITAQQLQPDFVRAKLEEIRRYQFSALHWNTSHFERDFTAVYRESVRAYDRIAQQHAVRLHSRLDHERVLERYLVNGQFSLTAFKAATLSHSESAAQREIHTAHRHELLQEGSKALFVVSNYLGGEYYLTADEVFMQDDILIIQEAKNRRDGRLSSVDDIKDGLFKLILYGNLSQVELDGVPVRFAVRLRLTCRTQGILRLPDESARIADFCRDNRFSTRQMRLIESLGEECGKNPGLSIHIGAA
jgi:hypothetical protein